MVVSGCAGLFVSLTPFQISSTRSVVTTASWAVDGTGNGYYDDRRREVDSESIDKVPSTVD